MDLTMTIEPNMVPFEYPVSALPRRTIELSTDGDPRYAILRAVNAFHNDFGREPHTRLTIRDIAEVFALLANESAAFAMLVRSQEMSEPAALQAWLCVDVVVLDFVKAAAKVQTIGVN